MTSSQYLVCGTTTPSPKIYFVGTQFSIPVDDTAAFPNGPTNCNTPPTPPTNVGCSQIFAQTPQASGNVNQNWQPGVPLTIEGSGFGTLPVGNLPYATIGWGSATTSYLTITDTPAGQPSWTSPNSKCQMYIQKWTDSSITVVPNVEPDMMNGTQTTISLLTETNPFSLLASPSCPVIAGDNIQVTVINPQTSATYTLPQAVPVHTFTGSSQLN